MKGKLEKIARGLPPLRRLKLSKKSQEKEDELKKQYEANKWWNDCIFQSHWHNFEWVNPRIKIKRKKPYSDFFKAKLHK